MPSEAVARFRRFARAVTLEVGALDDSFLGRGRPLGAARVLNAIGAGSGDVGEIRERLGLDSGLMSRLLRGLEEEGLVATSPAPDDARRRVAKLTAKAKPNSPPTSVFPMRAEAALARAPDAGKLLAAMDLVVATLGAEHIRIAETDPRDAAARRCLGRYYEELARRFDGGFEVSRSRDPDARDMTAPRGAFFVARLDGEGLGCVGLKGGVDFAEIKRLWVAPEARGLGLGRRLMAAAEARARQLGIVRLRLDTNRALPEAAAFYRRAGWSEISRFNDDPYAHLFFEKRLSC